MRKITAQITEAFLNFKTVTIGNSSTGNGTLLLHGNLIAEIKNSFLYITNAGWFTNTTKERLNALPGVSIYQKKGQWFLNGELWNGSWIKIKELN